MDQLGVYSTMKKQSMEFRILSLTLISNLLPLSLLLRKEVIQPQVPLRLPCYDFTPITNHTLGTCPPDCSELTQ